MKKVEINPDFKFSFENDAQLAYSERSGYIESYDMVRVCLNLDNGNSIDFPLKSREEYINEVNKINNDNAVVSAEFYQSEHMFDIYDYI
jgi:hypothetical protein